MLSRRNVGVFVLLLSIGSVLANEEVLNKNYFNELGWLTSTIKVSLEEEKNLYYVDVKQMILEDGIWTGHVIAYGHYIKPPYKFEIIDDSLLYLNGVQIYPRFKSKVAEYILKIRQAKIEKASKDTSDKRFEQMIEGTKRIYKENFAKGGRKSAIELTKQYLKNHSLVYKVSIVPCEHNPELADLELYLKEGILRKVPFLLTLRICEPNSEPPFIQPRNEEEHRMMVKEFLTHRKEEYEGFLRGEEVLILDRGGSGFRRWSTKRLITVIKIMRSPLSLQDKFEKLVEMQLLWEIAREIVYNFTNEEYPRTIKNEGLR